MESVWNRFGIAWCEGCGLDLGLWDVIVLERVIVGEDHGRAMLLQASPAIDASAAAVDHAPNADCSAHGQVCYSGAHARDPPHNLVAGHHGELSGARSGPFFVDLVHVGVADAGEENVDGDVVGPGGAAGDGVGDNGAFAHEGGVSPCLAHVCGVLCRW